MRSWAAAFHPVIESSDNLISGDLVTTQFVNQPHIGTGELGPGGFEFLAEMSHRFAAHTVGQMMEANREGAGCFIRDDISLGVCNACG